MLRDFHFKEPAERIERSLHGLKGMRQAESDRRILDRELTISAIHNLIDNAVIRMHVRDQCPGISKEELNTIFEPFKRGHSDKPGTGLGLAIARRAAEAQG